METAKDIEFFKTRFKFYMTCGDPVGFIKELRERNLLHEIVKLPDSFLDWDMDQETPHHELTVWGHTISVMESVMEISKNLSDDDSFILLVAGLLHDTGKLNPRCHGKKKVKNIVKKTYYGHESHSMRAAEYALSRLPCMSSVEIERVKNLIDGSRRVNPNFTPTDQPCNQSGKTLGKFVRLMGDDWQLAILYEYETFD